jgi:hypothetical protein
MNIVNLTPHALCVRKADGSVLVIEPSGTIARCAVTRVLDFVDSGIEVFTTRYGQIENLPDGIGYSEIPLRESESILNAFVVSAIVLTALGGTRQDVFCPGEAIRDDAGRVVGCVGLSH